MWNIGEQIVSEEGSSWRNGAGRGIFHACSTVDTTYTNPRMSSTILIVGAGLMGPAAAYNALRDPDVSNVVIADLDNRKLADAREKLSMIPESDKLITHELDLANGNRSVALMKEADVVLTALPWQATVTAVRAALKAGVPLVDLAIPDDVDMAELRVETDRAGGFILLGCGLEPGLTEIEARRLAGMMDEAHEFHIMVGGIPETPTGPLGYKIVFGGDRLPLRWIDALVVEDGEKRLAPRYSGIERASFAGVGEVEAWNEGVIPWLLEQPEFAGLRHGTQKTIRWPGYAIRAQALNELGLLSTEPVRVGDVEIVPKDLVDTVLRPHVIMGPEDRDITLFRVDVRGVRNGKPVTLRTEMIDRFDEETGFTSMARTTAFTGAILARMIASGEISASGLQTPDLLVTGSRYKTMFDELAKENIRFRTTELGSS